MIILYVKEHTIIFLNALSKPLFETIENGSTEKMVRCFCFSIRLDFWREERMQKHTKVHRFLIHPKWMVRRAKVASTK